MKVTFRAIKYVIKCENAKKNKKWKIISFATIIVKGRDVMC